ncbi:MAG: 16S rRNA (adenine(1518)-N(6)/adenine(1519)-N(6))-dimethyltransferase RsmA, partial [Candidatus Omnitrophota bacterium]
MLTVSELKAVLAKYDVRPKRYLGQNFLVDQNIAKKIIQLCGFSGKDCVLEIGAGLGALTEQLLNLVKEVVAVERDRKLCAALGESLSGFDNVKIVCADFLKLDLRQMLEGGLRKIKVIGNLPYYITTPIIEKLIEEKDRFDSIFITVQKEVAQRLCAKPGGKDYGSISCYLQFYMKPNILFHIGKRAF